MHRKIVTTRVEPSPDQTAHATARHSEGFHPGTDWRGMSRRDGSWGIACKTTSAEFTRASRLCRRQKRCWRWLRLFTISGASSRSWTKIGRRCACRRGFRSRVVRLLILFGRRLYLMVSSESDRVEVVSGWAVSSIRLPTDHTAHGRAESRLP